MSTYFPSVRSLLTHRLRVIDYLILHATVLPAATKKTRAVSRNDDGYNQTSQTNFFLFFLFLSLFQALPSLTATH